MLCRAHIVGGRTRWLCCRSVMLNALSRILPVKSLSMFSMFLSKKFLHISLLNFVLHTLVSRPKHCYDPTSDCLLTLRRGGWWGRERPSRSRGSPWWSQGGEGSAGPGGLLRTDLLKMTRLEFFLNIKWEDTLVSMQPPLLMVLPPPASFFSDPRESDFQKIIWEQFWLVFTGCTIFLSYLGMEI